MMSRENFINFFKSPSCDVIPRLDRGTTTNRNKFYTYRFPASAGNDSILSIHFNTGHNTINIAFSVVSVIMQENSINGGMGVK